MTLVCDLASHLIASALLSIGPSQDAPLFQTPLRDALLQMEIDCLLADTILKRIM